MKQLADAVIFATKVQAVVTPDGDTAGIVGWSRSGEEIGLSMDSAAAVTVIVDFLHGFYKAPGFVSVDSGTTSGVLETVPINQAVLGIGENGEPLLSMVIGQARLTFQLGSVVDLRKLGAAALEMATVIERGASNNQRH